MRIRIFSFRVNGYFEKKCLLKIIPTMHYFIFLPIEYCSFDENITTMFIHYLNFVILRPSQVVERTLDLQKYREQAR